MFKHILIPTDGSELSQRAVASGVELAQSTGARVTGFFAKEVYPLTFYGEYIPADALTPEEFDSAEQERAIKYLAAIEEAAKAAGVACETLTATSNHPYEAILKAAEERGCDLIYMATHGRKGISGLLMGSETNKVLTHAKVPVLAYR
jgi:nucleotide-binding universal stress UspA family protein